VTALVAPAITVNPAEPVHVVPPSAVVASISIVYPVPAGSAPTMVDSVVLWLTSMMPLLENPLGLEIVYVALEIVTPGASDSATPTLPTSASAAGPLGDADLGAQPVTAVVAPARTSAATMFTILDGCFTRSSSGYRWLGASANGESVHAPFAVEQQLRNPTVM
jgi:hypothetical protein